MWNESHSTYFELCHIRSSNAVILFLAFNKSFMNLILSSCGLSGSISKGSLTKNEKHILQHEKWKTKMKMIRNKRNETDKEKICRVTWANRRFESNGWHTRNKPIKKKKAIGIRIYWVRCFQFKVKERKALWSTKIYKIKVHGKKVLKIMGEIMWNGRKRLPWYDSVKTPCALGFPFGWIHFIHAFVEG